MKDFDLNPLSKNKPTKQNKLKRETDGLDRIVIQKEVENSFVKSKQ